MIVAGGQLGNGRDLVVVGLDFENLDRLRAGKPARSDLEGLPLVILHAAPTLRDVVEELVQAKVLPEEALDGYRAPREGEVVTWDPERGHVPTPGRTHPPDDSAGRADRSPRRTAAADAVLDVLAPKRPELDGERRPVFAWPDGETVPTDGELAELARDVADAVLAATAGEATGG